MKNKMAIKTNCYLGFSAEESLNGLKESSFDLIEISASPNSNIGISRFSDFSLICELKKRLEKDGLKPISLGGHTNIMNIEKTEDFINNLYLANFFGCQYFVSNMGISKDSKEEISDEKIAKQISVFIPYLEKLHLTLVIELHGKYSTGKSLMNILKLVNNNLVKINYDTGNAIFYGGLSKEELLEDFENCIDNVGYMHLKDKLGRDDEWNFPALGKGKVEFEKFFKILSEHKNDCPLIAELEFTSEGVKDINEVKEAVKDSYIFLKETMSKYE